MRTPLGLVLAFVSAVAISWAYSLEHDAVSKMPPFSPRHPVRLVSALLADRGWLLGFGAESGGWLVYVAALRLAPIAIVQAVGASGIAVLAFASVHGHPSRLVLRERLAVVVGFAGLVLLALSLVGTSQADRTPGTAPAVLWVGAAGAVGFVLAVSGLGLARAPALGLAAGILFAGGDICSKLVGYGGGWLVAAVPLVALYALGTSMLQRGFQHGDALTAAGLATLATNAIPIAAGFVVFDEQLPGAEKGVLQLVGFATLVVGAALLARVQRPAVETRPGTSSSAAGR
jgi:hypothetical protein